VCGVCVYEPRTNSNAFSNVEIERPYKFASISGQLKLSKEFSLLVFVRFLACFTAVFTA